MRKVECKRITYEGLGSFRHKKETVIEGLFHQWGSDFEEFETGPGNMTVAIVELPDGTVETFVPHLIKFIEAA
ncbi:TPA: hypothetical protein N0X70_001533 [Enterobacter roggenkampii]|uniref:hypothetical protein n=1 Tax=Enterobacter roggenkampii TaxID=1812935 RepID=UPI000385B85E|nr:hypothetical protein [Enterobacter roggenkampii]CAH5462713.1 hypothetical protein AI2941V1_0265 [Enterobacter cloacae]EPY97115.1 hypothetical protein L799_08805 [Enterobacter roggenkampii EC_38VIM1]KTK00454.1 hypothetical protein ASU70_07595 [Enterobacter roggenkampii]HCK7123704.1 hypothetical protein [Enterobacter roggenkampii]HCK7190705.1 hypothetical protein [Enterobacter roggenkampii]